jgi:hypothetical protein
MVRASDKLGTGSFHRVDGGALTKAQTRFERTGLRTH